MSNAIIKYIAHIGLAMLSAIPPKMVIQTKIPGIISRALL